MRKIIITGGAGFIGSHVVDAAVRRYTNAEILVIDKMNYAANVNFLLDHLKSGRINLRVADVAHYNSMLEATKDVDLIVHLAAESHVGRSFENSIDFTRTNTLGTHVLLEAARQQNVARFIHVSTDEVYGEVLDGAVQEQHPFHPNNPYSGSKAAAEMIIQSYWRSFGTPTIVIRANNMFGRRQFPEKIIPKFIIKSIEGAPLTIHGDGSHRRHYLAAEDFAEALFTIVRHAEVGLSYNVGGNEEYSNIEIARMICEHFRHEPEKNIVLGPDRPFNDRRYSLDSGRLAGMGWRPRRSLKDSLPGLVDWYKENYKLWKSMSIGSS